MSSFQQKIRKYFFLKKNNPFKEKNKYLVNKPKETKIQDLLDYFKTFVLNILNELNGNRDRQLSRIRKIIYEQNENSKKDRDYTNEPYKNSGDEKKTHTR